MSWERILQNDKLGSPLRGRIDELFAQQRATWPMLRDGETALQQLERKTLVENGDSVIVQVNPARRRSTLAKTDAQSIAARACFLCPENMPTEERGVSFENLVLLPNPFPVLPLHCTVADREHRPQAIEGRVRTFVRLAQEIGPDMAALYNGPRCGASAPDHFHLQAATAAEIPLLGQLSTLPYDRAIVPHSTFSRNMLVFHGENASEITTDVEQAINALRQISESNDEPMLNLLGHYDANNYTVVLFPRAAHRPACYFATGDEQLLVSPAVLEMCGVLVTTEMSHFARIDARMARSIYEEVGLEGSRFVELMEKVAFP